MINIRQLSIRCGHCGTYQTLCHFRPGEDWNAYTYECENDRCDPEVTRTLLEVPVELDAFARRDPEWGGGRRHAGAAGADDRPAEAAEARAGVEDSAELVQLGAGGGNADSDPD